MIKVESYISYIFNNNNKRKTKRELENENENRKRERDKSGFVYRMRAKHDIDLGTFGFSTHCVEERKVK